MSGPVAASLGPDRLHLQHGPIDLIIGAEGAGEARDIAFRAAARQFSTILGGLAEDLPAHRKRISPETPDPSDPVAWRMYRATRAFSADQFITPMAAVAGAVADTVLDAMTASAPLDRAFVNNGGDIALHLRPGRRFDVALAGLDAAGLGQLRVTADSAVRGIATSGSGGRSLSFGIADSVTVLAHDAATADAAATLIANAVDLPDHPGIERRPACNLYPDSDLGARAVVTRVPELSARECRAALAAGAAQARKMLAAKLITGAALFLQGEALLVGQADVQRIPGEQYHHV